MKKVQIVADFLNFASTTPAMHRKTYNSHWRKLQNDDNVTAKQNK